MTQLMVVVSALVLCQLAASHASPLTYHHQQLSGEVSGQWRPVYQLSREWCSWKTQHKKSYISDSEELERHLIWLSNVKYIEGHNANEHIFGYRLSMNQYGDMVGEETDRQILSFIAGSLYL